VAAIGLWFARTWFASLGNLNLAIFFGGFVGVFVLLGCRSALPAARQQKQMRHAFIMRDTTIVSGVWVESAK